VSTQHKNYFNIPRAFALILKLSLNIDQPKIWVPVTRILYNFKNFKLIRSPENIEKESLPNNNRGDYRREARRILKILQNRSA
jgi:hypothetical protein